MTAEQDTGEDIKIGNRITHKQKHVNKKSLSQKAPELQRPH